MNPSNLNPKTLNSLNPKRRPQASPGTGSEQGPHMNFVEQEKLGQHRRSLG